MSAKEIEQNSDQEQKQLSKKEIKLLKKLEKVKKIYKKRYSKKALEKKIYKKLYIPSDKEFIKKFVVEVEDPKTHKIFFEFDKNLIKDKNDLNNLNRIAKEIAAQKCRVNIFSILMASACVFGILFFIFIFRNFLARKIVVSGSEAAFGAKCDVELVDFDLLHTRFRIQNYKVANKKEPMRNLFEIKNIEFYFNLLELSRGKFVAENMAIEGFTWGTERKTSGALPPKKHKKNTKPNPVAALISKEVKKVTDSISLDNGIKSVQDQIDPKKIFEREIAALKTPAVKDEILSLTPSITEKWINAKVEIETQSVKTIDAAKKIALINFSNMNDVEQIKNTIVTITQAFDTGKQSFDLAENMLREVRADVKNTEQLAKNAHNAFISDFQHIKNTAARVKQINADSGKKLISQLFNVFLVNALGKYYPYFSNGLTYLQNSQNKPKQPKALTLEQKSKNIARLPGTTFYFGKKTLPSFVIKNILLSGHHPTKDVFSIGGSASGITNDANKLDEPLIVKLNASHGKMKEHALTVVDLRSKSSDLVEVEFGIDGFDLSIPSSSSAIPSLNGLLKTAGNVKISQSHDLMITSDVSVSESALVLEKFEPEFIYDVYKSVLNGVKTINLKTILTINNGENFSLDINTDVDDQIAAAIQKELLKQVEKIRAEVILQGEKWLNEQKEIYKNEIDACMHAADNAQKIMTEIKNSEKILNDKKAEAEKRIKELAAGAIKNTVDSAVKDVFKGFF